MSTVNVKCRILISRFPSLGEESYSPTPTPLPDNDETPTASTDPSLSPALEPKQATQSGVSAHTDQWSDNFTAVLHRNSCSLFRFLSFSGWFFGFRASHG